MCVPKIEKIIGIEVYATSSPGIGGTIKHFAEDFIVEEILVNGSKAGVQKQESRIIGSPTLREPYLLCVLVKRGKDAFITLKAIARQLGISTDYIQIAGIKDTKAVTAQHITLKKVSAEDVQKVSVKGVEVYPIGYFRTKISSHYLLGNHFQAVIRNINHSKSTVKERVTKTVEEIQNIGGVPNFFGHQRFGTTRPITHLVGKALLQGSFERAAMLFLAKSTPHEHPESRQVRRQLWKTRDFKSALKDFPKKLHYERLMLRHLAKKPKDFIGAFRRLPKKLLSLFPQAYQSYLFNKFLSRRISFGLALSKAEIGDYVVKVESSGLPAPNVYEVTCNATLFDINEAIKAGKMRVALPIVGFRQQLSRGIQGEIEKQILDEEEISLENFKVKGMPELSMKGELRTALTPLNDFSLNEISRDNVNPLKWKAKVSFMLQRGSYATIFLREVMKTRNPIKSGF
ncbi:MAG: tRNA pseudouridine(13) synthase TruD [Candidatus Bathyarchaeia archaeon]